jgi:hypothetical protein
MRNSEQRNGRIGLASSGTSLFLATIEAVCVFVVSANGVAALVGCSGIVLARGGAPLSSSGNPAPASGPRNSYCAVQSVDAAQHVAFTTGADGAVAATPLASVETSTDSADSCAFALDPRDCWSRAFRSSQAARFRVCRHSFFRRAGCGPDLTSSCVSAEEHAELGRETALTSASLQMKNEFASVAQYAVGQVSIMR